MHISRHTSEGFALQLVEGMDAIADTVDDECKLYDTCANWNNWVDSVGFYQQDSGV